MEAGGAVVRATLRCRVSVRIMPRVFYARRNRRNSPSMARFLLASASMPRHFCALQHNSTDTKQLRYSPALQYHLPPPPAYATYAEIQCAGPHLRFGRHGALSLHVGSSKLTTLPTRHTKLAAGHAVCSEENYELPRGSIFPNNKKAPAYPQSIRTWARGYLHNFLKNILHATTASSQPLCGKLKTYNASHSHHRPTKLRQRILLHS